MSKFLPWLSPGHAKFLHQETELCVREKGKRGKDWPLLFLASKCAGNGERFLWELQQLLPCGPGNAFFFFFIAATLVWLMAKLRLLLLAPALWIAQGRKKWSIALGCLWERDVSTATTTTLCFLRSTGKIPVPALCWGPCFVGSSFVKSHERLGLECRSKNWVLPKTCF